MACYAIPLAAAFLCYGWRKARAPTPNYLLLNLMLFGGAIFGVVDHAWYGELLMIGPDWVTDGVLGIVITLAIVACWGVMVALPSLSPVSAKTTRKNC